MKLSEPATILVTKMLLELSECKRVYRRMAIGCYEYCIYRYGLQTPTESVDTIVDYTLQILNSANDT